MRDGNQQEGRFGKFFCSHWVRFQQGTCSFTRREGRYLVNKRELKTTLRCSGKHLGVVQSEDSFKSDTISRKLERYFSVIVEPVLEPDFISHKYVNLFVKSHSSIELGRFFHFKFNLKDYRPHQSFA